jgi:putative DNA primase/helicase
MGISVIPIHPANEQGSKRPAVAWKQYQQVPATAEQVHEWFTGTNYGLAIITGRVSGNLEMIELEGRAAHEISRLKDLAENSGLDELWQSLTRGWSEATPSGGLHYYLRSTQPVAGNTKLARRASTPNELETHQNQKIQVLAETRGEGGYSICAPTPGTHHETGRAWTSLFGNPTTVPTFTGDEVEALHSLFKTLDQPIEKPTEKPTFTPTVVNGMDSEGVKPGEDYNQKATWQDILEPHGWTLLHTDHSGTTYWRRPGKTTPGISATTGHADDADRLYVFSTSTEFETETPISKFHAHAILNYNGDHQACAKDLARQGYGKPTEKIVLDIPQRQNNPTPTLSGEEATVEGNTVATIIPMPGNTATSIEGSEDYDALNIVETYQNEITYCIERSKWLHWNGHVWEWQPQDGGYVRELARHYARTITPENSKQETWKKAALKNSGITGRLSLASTDRRVARKANEFDAHPLELNTPGGIVNLATGELMESDPAKLHTKTTTVTPKNMPTPRWDKFLDDTFNKDAEIIAYVRDLLGYAATGVIRNHILPFFYGAGGNGKSVLTDVIMHLLGDYAGSAPAGFLMAKTITTHETEIARLDGLRFVVSSEINPSDRFDEAKVKLLTGGDQLTARRMREDHYDFRPTHKLFLMGNHQPRVSAGGPSFWRRLRLIGFTNQVRKEDMIDNLTDLLIEEEGPGILQWVVDGAANMLTNGLNEPKSVIEASQEYAEEEDSLARFVTEHLKLGGGDAVRVPQADVKRRYKQWCDEQAEKPMSGHMFTRELKKRFQIGRLDTNGTSFYTNATLYAAGPEPDENDAWNDLGGAL